MADGVNWFTWGDTNTLYTSNQAIKTVWFDGNIWSLERENLKFIEFENFWRDWAGALKFR